LTLPIFTAKNHCSFADFCCIALPKSRGIWEVNTYPQEEVAVICVLLSSPSFGRCLDPPVKWEHSSCSVRGGCSPVSPISLLPLLPEAGSRCRGRMSHYCGLYSKVMQCPFFKNLKPSEPEVPTSKGRNNVRASVLEFHS
jgi:hypothetical protein